MLKFLKKKREQRNINTNRTQKALATELYYQHQNMHSATPGIGNNIDHHLLVSLTSFPQRIDTVYLVIESLFQQWVKADVIILWLSKENFPGGLDSLPESLKKQCQRGLQISFVAGDIGPYKKITYAVREFPDSLILTVDDDILYPPDLIDQLYRSYLRAPTTIHSNRAHKIAFDTRGRVKPYHLWQQPQAGNPAEKTIFPTGNAGVLYFPGCFSADVTNESLFMELAPKADDIWLKAMTLVNDIDCQVTASNRHWRSRFLSIQNIHSPSLTSINKGTIGGNDDKLKAVFDHYNLWQKLR